MQLYAITDRKLFPSSEALIKQAARWAKGGVDILQIREKDLSRADLTALATRIVRAVRSAQGHTRILLNGPAKVAIEAGCNGIHLTADQPGSAVVKAKAFMRAVVTDPIISVSCHTIADVERARNHGAALAIFAPVFEKRSGQDTVLGQGLQALADACRIAGTMPVFALGGVTAENAHDCIDAGASGIAAIRLFASDDWLTLRSRG